MDVIGTEVGDSKPGNKTSIGRRISALHSGLAIGVIPLHMARLCVCKILEFRLRSTDFQATWSRSLLWLCGARKGRTVRSNLSRGDVREYDPLLVVDCKANDQYGQCHRHRQQILPCQRGHFIIVMLGNGRRKIGMLRAISRLGMIACKTISRSFFIAVILS